jgi:hypothetical protein
VSDFAHSCWAGSARDNDFVETEHLRRDLDVYDSGDSGGWNPPNDGRVPEKDHAKRQAAIDSSARQLVPSCLIGDRASPGLENRYARALQGPACGTLGNPAGDLSILPAGGNERHSRKGKPYQVRRRGHMTEPDADFHARATFQLCRTSAFRHRNTL